MYIITLLSNKQKAHVIVYADTFSIITSMICRLSVIGKYQRSIQWILKLIVSRVIVLLQ